MTTPKKSQPTPAAAQPRAAAARPAPKQSAQTVLLDQTAVKLLAADIVAALDDARKNTVDKQVEVDVTYENVTAYDSGPVQPTARFSGNTVQNRSALDDVLSELSQTINRTSALTDQLTDRLGGVLTPTDYPDGARLSEPSAPMAPLVRTLDDLDTELIAICDRLATLLTHLAL